MMPFGKRVISGLPLGTDPRLLLSVYKNDYVATLSPSESETFVRDGNTEYGYGGGVLSGPTRAGAANATFVSTAGFSQRTDLTVVNLIIGYISNPYRCPPLDTFARTFGVDRVASAVANVVMGGIIYKTKTYTYAWYDDDGDPPEGLVYSVGYSAERDQYCLVTLEETTANSGGLSMGLSAVEVIDGQYKSRIIGTVGSSNTRGNDYVEKMTITEWVKSYMRADQYVVGFDDFIFPTGLGKVVEPLAAGASAIRGMMQIYDLCVDDGRSWATEDVGGGFTAYWPTGELKLHDLQWGSLGFSGGAVAADLSGWTMGANCRLPYGIQPARV